MWRQGDGAMDTNTLEVTIKAYLKEMRGRLDRAAGIAWAAEACAEAGNIPKALSHRASI